MYRNVLLENLQRAVPLLTYETYCRAADVLYDAAQQYAADRCVDRFNAMNNTGAYREALDSRLRFICNAFDPFNATAPYAAQLFYAALKLPSTPWQKLLHEQRAAVNGESLLFDIDKETLRKSLSVFSTISELNVDPRYSEYSADRAARLSGVERAVSRLYTCAKCHHKECYIRTVIIRSQDEGYNTRYTCVRCGHNWTT